MSYKMYALVLETYLNMHSNINIIIIDYDTGPGNGALFLFNLPNAGIKGGATITTPAVFCSHSFWEVLGLNPDPRMISID